MSDDEYTLFDIPSRPVPKTVADILDLIAGDPKHQRKREAIVTAILSVAHDNLGVVDADRVRERIPRWVDPRVIGATYHALATAGVLTFIRWKVSEDVKGRNSGRPARVYRLTRHRPAAVA